MKITLHWHDHAPHPIHGAFAGGTSAAQWLAELDAWGIQPEFCSFYLIAGSFQTAEPAGIFVTFVSGTAAHPENIRSPFTRIGKKLYIPCHASLWPAVTEQELNKVLLYDTQVFLPSRGLAGFDAKDAFAFADFFRYTLPQFDTWDKAIPGGNPLPALQRIRMEKPPASEVLSKLNEEGIGGKPLSELKDGKGQNSGEGDGEDFWGKVQRGLLGGAIAGTGWLSGWMGSGSGSGNSFLGKANEWLQQRMEDLQKKRESEMEKLLRMFDENMAEALRYALPLNSPYFNRGTGTPTSNLSENKPDFNLGGIGGGAATDSWDASKFYRDLREKYQRAAKEAIAQGDFRKAAYIYAHLLGDFSSAANTLKQGHHYYEAAILYKDHLKNNAAAAECFELAGMYPDAIDIYIELKNYDKAGDLYLLIGQEQQALRVYRRCADDLIKAGDYIKAAEILDQKMNDRAGARAALLEGWQHSSRQDSCLLRYFELSEAQHLNREIQSLAENAFGNQRMHMLHVLLSIPASIKSEEVQHTCREIAYHWLSQAALRNNVKELRLLQEFVDGDKLISSDITRFAARAGIPVKEAEVMTTTTLEEGIVWKQGILIRGQYVFFGSRSGLLYTGRMYAGGNVRYYPSQEKLEPGQGFIIAADEAGGPLVIFYTGTGKFHSRIEMKSGPGGFKNAIQMENGSWLPAYTTGIAIPGEDEVKAMVYHNDQFEVHTFSGSGDLVTTVTSFAAAGEEQHAMEGVISNVLYRQGGFVFGVGNVLYHVSEKNGVRSIGCHADVLAVAASEVNIPCKVVVATPLGCYLYLWENAQWTDMDISFCTRTGNIADVKFLYGYVLAVASADHLEIFELKNNHPVKISELDCRGDIISILPGNDRNTICLLLSTGKVMMYQFKT